MITNYDNCPLGIYQDIERIGKDETREEIDKQVSILALLSGKTERQILNLPIADYQLLVVRAEFLGLPAPSAKRPLSKYHLGDFDLVPVLDLRKLTTAQYIDFQAYAPQGDAKLVELISVILVPEGMTYGDGYDPLDVQRAIREELTVTDAISLSAFFFSSWLRLTQDTLGSLEKEVRKAKKIKDPQKRAEKIQQIQKTKATLRKYSRYVGVGLRRLTL
ncbi:MAG: hypothetical protein K6A62_04670 [Bacteroidales bacterium]|nr:hypothetical protein [Bacteroidales bacterium]